MACNDHEKSENLTLTAALTNGIARVTHGRQESARLIDKILTMDHVESETTLYIGDTEYDGQSGPYPNHQFRVSVRPSTGYAALNYADYDDPDMPMANSYNPTRPLPEIALIFNGTTRSVFPRTAAIPIATARHALHEWLEKRKRPTCITWQPYDEY